MNKQAFKRPLIAVGLMSLVGAVGAQAYYTRDLARRVAATETQAPVASMPAPTAGQWDPWSNLHADMMRMQERMDHAFADMAHAGDFSGTARAVTDTAQVNLQEQGKDYLITARIPGAQEKDININLDGRLLSISAQSQGSDKTTADNGQVTRQERYSSAFQQAFTLPGPVNASGMQSQYQDGVLTVTIPKAR